MSLTPDPSPTHPSSLPGEGRPLPSPLGSGGLGEGERRGEAVRFDAVHRHYRSARSARSGRNSDGLVRAVDGVSLAIADGEFFAMLGPSGSGKTTCLRMIAGFDRPTAGKIELFGRDVTDLPPYERDVNTVFQDYALFPHLTVAQNVGYGLTIQRVPRAEAAARVAEALELVRLPSFGDRKPSQLSGGQRQRVALARALVNRPRVLLLDEPLGALDLKLRQQMQVELKSIHQKVGITFLFVTHDQEEALTLADRIAVFNQGKIEQIGTPAEIYERPRTPFVASFVGVTNLIEGALAERLAAGSAQRAVYSIRPEKIRFVPHGGAIAADETSVRGTIREAIYLGLFTRFIVDLEHGGELMVVEQNLDADSRAALAQRGKPVEIAWERAHLLALEG